MARTRAFNITEELNKIITQEVGQINAACERGLDKAAEFMRRKLEEATPVDTGRTQKSWITIDQYTGVRYIKNTQTNKKGIPIVNLLEFGAKGKPFVRRTFEANKDKVIEIIKGEIEHGNR